MIEKFAAAVIAFVLVTSASHYAEATSPDSIAENRDAELKAASSAAMKAAIAGPRDIPLLNQAILHLPKGYLFVPQPEASRFSRAVGNNGTDRLIGIATNQRGEPWVAYLNYFNDGHVADDDAKIWSADDMLSGLKEGTEAGNTERQLRGFQPLEVVGWIEQPAYDANTHHLVWSALVRDKDDPTSQETANYNTYALGRDGHFELDLVASADKVDGYKPAAKDLLGALEFTKGHRYADFNASTDRLAAYGIAALVGGVAAKKLGLIALAGAFVLKFAKLIGLAAIAGLASIKRLFGRAKKNMDQDTIA